MRTIRGRLAAFYAIALAGTMFMFAAVVFAVQRGENLSELDARAQLESNLIAATLSEAFRARGALVVDDPRTGRNMLSPDVSPFLEGVPGYVVLVASDGGVLHLSPDARALPYASLVRILAITFESDTVGAGGTLDLGPPIGEMRYNVRALTQAGPEVAAVFSGATTATAV